MKRKSLLICFAFYLISLLVVTVFAHPGRTDSNGGHTNHSTGEYHYHHGYPAHDHVDTNGDGIEDCPYDYDRKYNVSSNSNATSGFSTTTTDKATEPQEAARTATTKVITKTVDRIPPIVYWTYVVLAVIVLLLLYSVYDKSKELKNTIQQHQKETERETQYVTEKLYKFHNAIKKTFGEKYLDEISNVPEGSYIGTDLLPHTKTTKDGKPFDAYSFYLGGNPLDRNVKFHLGTCRHANYRFKINAYTLRKKTYYQSCNVCNARKRLPDTKWADEYLSHYTFLDKYLKFSKDNNER